MYSCSEVVSPTVAQLSLAILNNSKNTKWRFLLEWHMISFITVVVLIQTIISISGILFLGSLNILGQNIFCDKQKHCFNSNTKPRKFSILFKMQYTDFSYCTLLSKRSQSSGHPPLGGGTVGAILGRTVLLSLSQMKSSTLPQLRSFHVP